uniref:Uncharacterized protein n=1 Tax=Aegilops tauschii subsp. strangulata TaxID=200361 RepID=A0A453NAM1_AEGTS
MMESMDYISFNLWNIYCVTSSGLGGCCHRALLFM